METKTKPLRGIEIVRKMLENKKQAQLDFEEALRSDPKTQAIYEELHRKNVERFNIKEPTNVRKDGNDND
jgi:hypothetical protein